MSHFSVWQLPPCGASCSWNSKTPIFLTNAHKRTCSNSAFGHTQVPTHTLTQKHTFIYIKPVDKSYLAGYLWKPLKIKNNSTCVKLLPMYLILTIIPSSHHHTYGTLSYTHTLWSLTSGEGELNLLVNDLHSDEVVFFIEPAIVEQQSIPLSGSKPAERDENFKLLLQPRNGN